ncbi:hypothetical protein RSAG8_13874, partial [Rhizoctonia solani AG-8 WAC10335]
MKVRYDTIGLVLCFSPPGSVSLKVTGFLSLLICSCEVFFSSYVFCYPAVCPFPDLIPH